MIATAGHVDHGKSTLIRRLTGMEPDRWAEERRRGLTIGLGFAWTTLVDGSRVAFVDVPGHERFVPTMLAGVGPVPAVLFVVAADEGWKPQSTEHLSAVDALGVRHGLLVVTRADLADPGPATERARERIAGTSLGRVPAVAVSAVTGAGIPALEGALVELAARMPPADPAADVRLWVDRAFTIEGAGTVVTGTLAAGTVRAGDEFRLASTGRLVRVRGVQALGEAEHEVSAPARVAVNLRGVDKAAVRRGDALLTPDAWATTTVVDVALRAARDKLAGELMFHIGAAAVPTRVRPLGTGFARLRLASPLPLRVGDRALLRDPGRHEVVAAVDLLDVRPPELNRRGAARQRSALLQAVAAGKRDEAVAFRLWQRDFVRADELRVAGLPVPSAPFHEDWYADPAVVGALADRAKSEVDRWCQENPLRAGVPVETVRQLLDLPDAALVGPVAARAGLALDGGEVRRPGATATLPARVERALDELTSDLRRSPFAAPDANRLRELGLGPRELAAAVRAGRLARLPGEVVLLPDCERRAAEVLRNLRQPFTLSEARQALGTTRRVAVPLLELLDRAGVTQRLPDDTRRVTQVTTARSASPRAG